MQNVRVGVVGAGYFGRFHAEKYVALQSCDLVGIVDQDRERACQVAESVGGTGLTDHRSLIGEVDAVSIAVPTSEHFAVARDFLSNGIHVLVEKPITNSLETAEELIEIAERSGAILQVGHIERFSSAYQAIAKHLDNPLYIQSDRVAPFDPRIRDTDVVLDLMIHDIDIIMALAQSSVDSIDAVGTPVLSTREDIANSRIAFANGCVANVTASRVGQKSERRMRIFHSKGLLVVDFLQNRLVRLTRGDGDPIPGLPEFGKGEETFEKADSLRREIIAFLHCVKTGAAPMVDGEAGRAALGTALRIRDSLKAHRELIQNLL